MVKIVALITGKKDLVEKKWFLTNKFYKLDI